MVFCFPSHEMMFWSQCPGLSAEDQHDRRVNWPLVPTPFTTTCVIADICIDPNGHHHGSFDSAPLIRRELIDELKSSAEAAVAPATRRPRGTGRPTSPSPIFDLMSPHIAFGRVVLLGMLHLSPGHMSEPASPRRRSTHMGWRTRSTETPTISAAALRDTTISADGSAIGWWRKGRYLGGSSSRPTLSHPDVAMPRRVDPRQETIMSELGASGVIDGEPISARCTIIDA